MTAQKNLKVTFTVTALVSPEEFAKHMGYPEGDERNDIKFNEWGEEEFGECICTWSSQFSGWPHFFRITDRKVETVEETDEPFSSNYESDEPYIEEEELDQSTGDMIELSEETDEGRE